MSDDLDPSIRFQMSRIIEALLFGTSDPIPFEKLREILEQLAPVKPKQLKSLLNELEYDYRVQQRAFRLQELADGYVLRSCPEYSCYIEMLVKQQRTERLSQAALEVLAIVAYRQPITRPQIDAIRGVDSSGSLYSLIERGFVTATGRLEAPGRPTLYAITPSFLKHFGLRSLEELPPLAETI